MKTSSSLSKFLAKAQEGDVYWVELAKLDMSIVMERERKRAGFSYKALAEKLGTSSAYISKIFRGDANLTIETMVKLARCLGCELELNLKERAQETKSLQGLSVRQKPSVSAKSLRAAFSSFLDEDDGMTVGRFNLPSKMVISCNDQAYLDAA